MFNWLADKLIAFAMKRPYLHLDDSEGRRYMNRYWVIPYNRFGIAARVHHIVRSDEDRHFHDHPFTYISIVLRGGYWEVTPQWADEDSPMADYWGEPLVVGEARQWRGAGNVALRRATNWHRLELAGQWEKTGGVTSHVVLHDCWTLFITFPAVQDWGFLVNGVKVLARDYLAGRWNDTNYNG